jgi:hypothetical protein
MSKCTHSRTVNTPERPFVAAAGDNRAAHGNVSWTEICLDCGASRQVDRNVGTDYSEWVPVRWQWVGKPNSGDPGWQVGYSPLERLAVLAVRCRKGMTAIPSTPDGTPIPVSGVPRGALLYISLRPLSDVVALPAPASDDDASAKQESIGRATLNGTTYELRLTTHGYDWYTGGEEVPGCSGSATVAEAITSVWLWEGRPSDEDWYEALTPAGAPELAEVQS